MSGPVRLPPRESRSRSVWSLFQFEHIPTPVGSGSQSPLLPSSPALKGIPMPIPMPIPAKMNHRLLPANITQAADSGTSSSSPTTGTNSTNSSSTDSDINRSMVLLNCARTNIINPHSKTNSSRITTTITGTVETSTATATADLRTGSPQVYTPLSH